MNIKYLIFKIARKNILFLLQFNISFLYFLKIKQFYKILIIIKINDINILFILTLLINDNKIN